MNISPNRKIMFGCTVGLWALMLTNGLVCLSGVVTAAWVVSSYKTTNDANISKADEKAEKARVLAEDAAKEVEKNRRDLSDKLNAIQFDLAELKGYVYAHKEKS